MVDASERGEAETYDSMVDTFKTVSKRPGCDTRAGKRPHGCLHTGIGRIASIGSSLFRDSSKARVCADGADHVQYVGVLDGHDCLAVGCDRNVYLSVLLGQRLGLDFDAILDAGASHEDRLDTDELNTAISVGLCW